MSNIIKKHRPWKHVVSSLISLLFLFLTPELSYGQDNNSNTELDLESMSDQELELICIERGFELIRDENDEDLTHDDFVDAAKRCLAIEADMNEILEQNPELAEELLTEVDRLKEEKERMEEERERLLAEKERLEEQISEKEQRQQSEQQGSPKLWGANTNTQSESPSSSEKNNNTSEATTEDPTSGSSATTRGGTAFAPHKTSQRTETVADSDTSTTTTTTSVGLDDDEPIDDYDYIHEVDDKNETKTDSDECPPATNSSEEATSSSSETAATTRPDKTSTEFSLSGFIREVITEFEKDVHRITRLLYPVVRPLVEAKDVAWKYLRAMFDSAKRHVEKYQQKSSAGQDEGDDTKQKAAS